MIELILLIAGIAGMILGSHLAIKGVLNIARHFKISHLFIGLTVFAIGTDLPELVVHITGGVQRFIGIDNSGIVIGNTIGSTIGQIGLVLGVLGLFAYLTLKKSEFIRDGLMMLTSVLFLFLVSFDGVITRIEGSIFVILYILYFVFLFREEKVHEKLKKAPTMHLSYDLLALVGGFIILIFCSSIVLENAMRFATKLGIAQTLVGILIIGLGTSLPELFLTIGAIKKGAIGLGVGNLIGSNIFDILFVLGLGGIIAPINVLKSLLKFDILFLLFLSGLVLVFFKTKMKIVKKEAIILIVLFFVYVGLKLGGV